MKITHSQIEKVRVTILAAQKHICPLCRQPLRGSTTKKKPALDHNHNTGFIRGVLCINCNGAEGRVMRRAVAAAGELGSLDWLRNLVEYLTLHETPQWSAEGRRGLIHPTHKTANEKRVAQLVKAKAARLRRKAAAT